MNKSDSKSKPRVLVFSSLYPNPASERHGIFVETRLRKVLARGNISAEVIAPVPWLPRLLGLLGLYDHHKGIPKKEVRHGITVHHPRYIVIPRIGMLLTPWFMALSVWLCARKLMREGRKFDVLDAHYYYPDGVAAAVLSKLLKIPFSVTARGTDINLIPMYRLPRALILWAARQADASITVCKALKDRMIELGAESGKIHVLRNGVDLELFRPLDRTRCRSKYNIPGPTLLSVGGLVERKGHHLVIEALTHLPGFELLIAGDGEMEAQLKSLARRLKVEDRVRFLGALQQAQLVELYNAVEVLVLASSREGWANVLLESLACGTPVVATSIWGTPEVVSSDAAGRLVHERNASAIADQIKQLMQHYPDRADTRRYAENFSWDATAEGCESLMFSLAHGVGEAVGNSPAVDGDRAGQTIRGPAPR